MCVYMNWLKVAVLLYYKNKSDTNKCCSLWTFFIKTSKNILSNATFFSIIHFNKNKNVSSALTTSSSETTANLFSFAK